MSPPLLGHIKGLKPDRPSIIVFVDLGFNRGKGGGAGKHVFFGGTSYQISPHDLASIRGVHVIFWAKKKGKMGEKGGKLGEIDQMKCPPPTI